jgi:NTP pyrophosphatase (non-canonical NTP hydrolase)
MTAIEYQIAASRTLIDKPLRPLTDYEHMIVWNAIGVAGEAGELCERIKHGIFHNHGLSRKDVSEEIGDLIWYIAALCSRMNLNLADIMDNNIEKLKKRYPSGYTEDHSKERMDKIDKRYKDKADTVWNQMEKIGSTKRMP